MLEQIAIASLIKYQSQEYHQACHYIYHLTFRISKSKLGKGLLLRLMKIAQKEQAIALTLNARLTAVGFY